MNIAAQTVGLTVFSALRREFGGRRHAAKLLARAAQSTPGAAKRWLAGDCTPQAEQLIRLMANCRELRSDIIRLIDELEACERR